MLSVWPLHNNSASTVITETEGMQNPSDLGSVSFAAPSKSFSNQDTLLCTAGQCLSSGQIKLSQIRQALTIISYQDGTVDPSDNATVHLGLNDTPNDLSYYLVTTCSNGQTIQTHSIIVDEPVAPGTYRLEINDQPDDAFSVSIGTKLRNFNSQPSPQTASTVSFANQLLLRGYDVDLSPRKPDVPIEVTTYWQTQQRMNQIHNVALHLVDNTLTTQRFTDRPLGKLYPNILWAPGELTQDKHLLHGDHHSLPPGQYTLELRLYNYLQNGFQPLPMIDLETNGSIKHNPVLGHIRILDPAHTERPTFTRHVNFGQEIQFLGYDLGNTPIKPGETLSLTLYWQALNQPSIDYTVFAQLIGSDGLVWGQQDNQPQQGRYSTTAWVAGDRIVDRYEISVRDDAPAGPYTLLIGLYNWRTGERLTAIDEQRNHLPNNAAILDSIDIKRRL